ncbi:rxt2-like protein [Zalerion maritima]|uniref:Rxt2-like protein n=1 Tax=Zalerion maritima TaxID=339359 RepID=A0AAD5RVN7_9PEZI|nr:rxt2-like protein [Zalerion maritima]
MATQQMIFAETIAGLRRALKRKSYESDSDDEVEGPSNRGNKLKRKAKYVHQGQMAVPTGPEVYKEVIDHAGYQRAIINRNPIPVDEDGFDLDSDDDDDHIQDVMASAAENNPYSSIRLEQILAPLTTPSDLPSHPTMSRPYTSRTLTDLSLQGRDIMHKENQSLWKVKHLLTQLCGDHPWVPTDRMEGDDDLDLFDNQLLWPQAQPRPDAPTAEDNPTTDGTDIQVIPSNKQVQGEADTKTNASKPANATGDGDIAMSVTGVLGVENDGKDQPGISQPNGDSTASDDAQPKTSKPQLEGSGRNKKGKTPNGRGNSKEDYEPTEMNIERSVNSSSGKANEADPEVPAEESLIHPLFLQPESTRSNRDFFLPTKEATEIRRQLQQYVQRQEEICRGSKQLYEGLLKADRLRKMVLFWSKAEAHSGANRDLSDGEDWYDKDEWGLEEDLKKGHDDEEEEAQQNQKKTRNRR